MITLGNYIINFMAIGMAISLGTILGLIFKRGLVQVNEPRKWILIIELILIVSTLCLGVYNLIGFLYY